MMKSLCGLYLMGGLWCVISGRGANSFSYVVGFSSSWLRPCRLSKHLRILCHFRDFWKWSHRDVDCGTQFTRPMGMNTLGSGRTTRSTVRYCVVLVNVWLWFLLYIQQLCMLIFLRNGNSSLEEVWCYLWWRVEIWKTGWIRHLQCTAARNKAVWKEVLWRVEKWKEACAYLIYSHICTC